MRCVFEKKTIGIKIKMDRNRDIKKTEKKVDRATLRSKVRRSERLRQLMDDRLTETISSQPIPFDADEQKELLMALPLSDETRRQCIDVFSRKVKQKGFECGIVESY